MIRVFAVRAFTLSIAFVVLIGAAIFVGLQQPPSEWVSFLHLNDCELPYWIGIDPGKTTLADARHRIGLVYDNSSLYQFKERPTSFDVTYKSTGYKAEFSLNSSGSSSSQDTVTDIILEPYTSWDLPPMLPTMGELYDRLGEPEQVRFLIDQSPVMMYQGGQLRLHVAPSNCNRVTVEQAVTGIDIYALIHPSESNSLILPVPWRGFQRCYNFPGNP